MGTSRASPLAVASRRGLLMHYPFIPVENSYPGTDNPDQALAFMSDIW
jgi:hypothetical protein